MQYELKVYRASEGVTLLRIPASSAGEASRQAEAQGYRIITARKLPKALRLGERGRQFSATLFSQELLALLEAGLSLVEATDLLARKARHAETKNTLEMLVRNLREGKAFSQVLEAMPGTFSPLYVATVRTSERTGDLAIALRRYLAYQQQINLVHDKVIAASVYPVLLIGVGLLVILFLLGYVVPRFSKVYEDLGNDLPWMSRMLMYWGQFFSEHAVWISCSAVFITIAMIYGMTRVRTRQILERAFWSLPVVGEKMRLYQLARFTRTLSMLVNGGIPFVRALEMVGDLLHQPALRKGLVGATQAVREGRAVSEAFREHGLASDIGVRLIAVSERSGTLGDGLERVAKLYDDDIARWIEWFSKLFEPVLMIAIGLIIGVVVLLMYLPIFELASSIQ